jgi:transcriptional regulator GlxA family with amidase domain
MSRTTFNERFLKAFGRSAMDFLKETRLRGGARLLRTTDLPIKGRVKAESGT